MKTRDEKPAPQHERKTFPNTQFIANGSKRKGTKIQFYYREPRGHIATKKSFLGRRGARES